MVIMAYWKSGTQYPKVEPGTLVGTLGWDSTVRLQGWNRGWDPKVGS